MCKISVVIPCYNAGRYIEEAIESVKIQTFTDWEIVIVDDGSNDIETLKVLKKIKHPKIRILFQENQGPAAARNAAIEVARGEYILPLDADDYIADTYMEKALNVFENDSNVGIVYCRAEKFQLESGEWLLPEFSEQQMAIDNIIFCTAFYKKTDWKEAGKYPEYARFGMEDYGFWLRILRLGRTVYRINEILFYYRISTVSRTSLFMENEEAIIRTYADIFRDNIDFFSKHAEELFLHRLNLMSSRSLVFAKVKTNFPLTYKILKKIYRTVVKTENAIKAIRSALKRSL